MRPRWYAKNSYQFTLGGTAWHACCSGCNSPGEKKPVVLAPRCACPQEGRNQVFPSPIKIMRAFRAAAQRLPGEQEKIETSLTAAHLTVQSSNAGLLLQENSVPAARRAFLKTQTLTEAAMVAAYWYECARSIRWTRHETIQNPNLQSGDHFPMHQAQEEQRSSFRLDVPLHQLLTKPVDDRVELQPIGVPQRFPDPAFPQHPELIGPIVDDDWSPPEKRHWTSGQIYHAMQGWLFPYIRSRVTSGDFHPLIACLSCGIQVQSGLPLLLGL